MIPPEDEADLNELIGGQEPEETRSDRDEQGHFLPGNRVGKLGGRPPGSVDFVAVCRRKARESGVDLESLIWAVGRAMFNKAINGEDTTAAKIILDRICGDGKWPSVGIFADQRQIHLGGTDPAITPEIEAEQEKPEIEPATPAGPPVPSDRDLARYFRDLVDLSADLLDSPLCRDNPDDDEETEA